MGRRAVGLCRTRTWRPGPPPPPLVTRARRVRVRCQNGTTPLYMAALNGHLEVVRFLAEKAPDTVAQPANVRAGPRGTRGAGCACVRVYSRVCMCVSTLARECVSVCVCVCVSFCTWDLAAERVLGAAFRRARGEYLYGAGLCVCKCVRKYM